MDELKRVYAQRDASEKSDCTVVALSIAIGVPYDVAHRMLAEAGRHDRRGFRLSSWLREQRQSTICGYKVTAAKVPWLTLAQIRRDFPRGRFIVRKRGHVFAMIDGVILDYNTGNRTRITDIFHFER